MLSGVIEAYSKRIAALEESIQRVEEEFKAERALRLAEEELQRGEDKLQGNAQKRHWMQPNGDKKNKKGCLPITLLCRGREIPRKRFDRRTKSLVITAVYFHSFC